MDPNTAMETFGEGAKAATKLAEIIEKVFGPRWTRKQAEADAYADQKKLQTIRDNPDIDIIYVNGKFNAKQRTSEALASRAEQRTLAELIRQENNIENILEKTANELQSAERISDETVDDDWISRFFNIAKDVNNEEMQYLWSKILAGEIASPNSFSLRTLEVIRNLSPQEAKIFQKIIPLILHHGNVYFVLTSNDSLNKFNVSFSEILALDECGLIDSSATLTLNLDINKDNPEHLLSEKYIIVIKGLSEVHRKISFGIYPLTRAGRELFNTLQRESSKEYAIEAANQIFTNNKATVATSVYQVTYIKRNNIEEQCQLADTPLALFTIETTK